MNRATEDQLDELHRLTVETLREEIEKYRRERTPVPPALLAQALKILKDNGVDAPARARVLSDTLKDEMPDFDAEEVH